MSLEAIDAASEAVRSGGFRITLADLRSRVVEVEYIERETLNIAILRLDNGFWLVGKSAPVDPDNYNAEYGRQLAHDDALRQAWPLLAFAHLETDRARVESGASAPAEAEVPRVHGAPGRRACFCTDGLHRR